MAESLTLKRPTSVSVGIQVIFTEPLRRFVPMNNEVMKSSNSKFSR